MNSIQKIFLVVILIFSGLSTLAQVRFPVVARITQKAPYPIYLQDYANPSQTNFSIQLEVRDNSLPLRQVRLRLYINGPGGLIRSNPLVRDEQVITLSAGQFYDLPSNLVANYFQSYNLNISPVQYSQNLVDGTYQFGVEVIDDLTNKPLSSVQYAAPVWLVVNDPPVLFTPDNETNIIASDPQFLNFQWVPRHRNVTDVSYEFSLTELNVPLDYTGNIQNLFLAQPPFYTEITTQTQLNYDYSKPPLIPGKIYAYRVRAAAKNGLEEIGMFRNNGYSEIRWFRYVEPLLAPYDENLSRLTESGNLQFEWKGYENHKKYFIRWKAKSTDWQQEEILSSESLNSNTEHLWVLNDVPEGAFEYQIGAGGNDFQDIAWGGIKEFKDPLPKPITNVPTWKNSKLATVSWYGHVRFESYQLLYQATTSDDWIVYNDMAGKILTVDEASQIFNVDVTGLDSTSSYHFKIVGIDTDRDTVSSKPAYLKYWNVITVINTEEKEVSGTLYWSFLEQERALGSVSGEVQREVATNSEEVRFVHSDYQTAGLKYPLGKVNVEIFADTACTVLLKNSAVNEFGGFSVKFPSEALRGGLLPSVLVLRVKHPVFGEFRKKIYPKIFDNVFDLGDWIIPAKTFRFTPLVANVESSLFNPDEHLIKVYRRVSALNSDPYLQFENFGRGAATPVKINNEEYFKIAELKPGQTLAGMFYARETQHPANEFLIQMEGPLPFDKRLINKKLSIKEGVYELRLGIDQIVGQPHIFGDIIFDVPKSGGQAVKIELTSSSGHTETISSVSTYRFNLPLSEIESVETYTIKAYVNNQIKLKETFNLDKKSLGTRRDLLIKEGQYNLVVAQVFAQDKSLLTNAVVRVNENLYRTNDNGFVFFWALENSEVVLNLEKVGFEMSSQKIFVQSQTNPISSFSEVGEIKEAIFRDIDLLKAKHVELQNVNYHRSILFLFNRKMNPFNKMDNEYVGAAFFKVETDAKPKPFTINFLVKNAYTGTKMNNVAIVENGLDNLGKTDRNGEFTFLTQKGRGTVTYKIIPDAASGYPEKEIAFDFPILSSNETNANLVITLDNRNIVEGDVLEIGTGKPIPNARVKIEYLTTVRYVTTNSSGHYKAYIDQLTEEENFLIITGTKDSFFEKVVHVAVSSNYSNNYQRDIYLKPKPNSDPSTDSDFKFLKLFGFDVEITKRENALRISSGKFAFDFEGILFDREGNSYAFTLKQAYISERNILPREVNIPLTLKSGKNLYLKKIPVNSTEPVFLSSIARSLTDGLIYTNKLNIDTQSLSSDFFQVYSNTNLNDPSKFKITRNNKINRIDFRQTPFPIAHSSGQDPILSIEFYPNENIGDDLVQKLKEYYQSDAADLRTLEKLFSNVGVTHGIYGFKNFMFTSMIVKPSGIELNNLVVIPLMSLSNVHISLMNIDKLRLADDKISDVLIDYSKSPRKLTMGADVLQAQIEEVYATDEGVDITYFTNNGGNVIKPNTPSITEIRYNSNGIFYSDFKRQKQIVQTAAVLNPVYMYKFPKPAMGPGYRIKVTSTADIEDQAFDFFSDPTDVPASGYSGSSLNTTASSSSSAAPSSSSASSAFPRLILEGYSSVELQPHIFKMKWKFENETQKWSNELEDFESTDFWGYFVLRPISVKGSKLDIDLPQNADTGDADMNTGTLAIKYGVTVPIVGSYSIDTKAKWVKDSAKFYRENIQAKVSTKIASILAFEAKFILLLDEIEGKIDGLFCKVAGKLELAKFADKFSFEGSGGYVNVEGDPIFGFSVGVGNDVTQQKQKGLGTFKLMNGRFSFLYDGPNSAVFMQMSADMGFGKKQNWSSDLRQFSPEPSDWVERERQSKHKDAITKRWKTAKDNFKKEGVVDARLVAFNEMFMMSEGNSAFNVDDHKVTLKKAELGLAISATEGATLTGSGILFIEGQQLLEAAFLLSFVKADADSANWRVFVGIPSFNKNVAGPFTDLSANFQIDMGESDGVGNFLLMGAIDAEWPVHPIVYLKLGAKFVLAFNAVANSSELQSSTRAGGQTLSKTASNIVKFMGSNFNSIAEKSIQQRISFFNAIDQEVFLDADGRFSGLYVGLKAAVMLGFNRAFESTLVAGSARFGIGVELGAGLLKSFTDYALELRFKVGLVAEINIRASAPIEADILNINIELPTFCGAGLSNDPEYKDWKWRFLVSFLEFDDVIGYSEASSVDCNSAGFYYIRPCIYFYFYSNPDYEKYANGLFEVSTEPNNFSSNTCPIEW